MELEGRVVLVTGAGRGIGRALAHAFAEAGAKVALLGKTKKNLLEVQKELKDSGASTFVVAGGRRGRGRRLARRGGRRAAARARGRPREQRRDLRGRPRREDGRGRLRPRSRRQPARAVPHVARRPARDEVEKARAHREHRLDRGPPRVSGRRRLLRVEVRPRRALRGPAVRGADVERARHVRLPVDREHRSREEVRAPLRARTRDPAGRRGASGRLSRRDRRSRPARRASRSGRRTRDGGEAGEKPAPAHGRSPPHAKGTSRPRPRHHHVEAHFSGSEIVRDVVLGMSDGLTVPFALAAGLSGAVANARVILIARRRGAGRRRHRDGPRRLPRRQERGRHLGQRAEARARGGRRGSERGAGGGPEGLPGMGSRGRRRWRRPRTPSARITRAGSIS